MWGSHVLRSGPFSENLLSFREGALSFREGAGQRAGSKRAAP